MAQTPSKLVSLRTSMRELGIAALVVPSSDEHLSEYVPSHDKRRAFISDFTGSAGTAVVTEQDAMLWTDGRYWLQATHELQQPSWKLMKSGQPDVPTYNSWLMANLPKGSKVGFDPKVTSIAEANDFISQFTTAGLSVELTTPNLVDAVWGAAQPPTPGNPIVIQDMKYAGQEWTDKVRLLREKFAAKNVHGLVVSALDEVAWLLNIRGSDIPFNPVVCAYVLLTADTINFYVDASRVHDELRTHLRLAQGIVTLRPADALVADIAVLGAAGKRLWMDPDSCNYACEMAIGNASLVEKAQSPIAYAKAAKNPVELAGMREAHIQDAAAVINYLSWLDEQIRKGPINMDEVVVSDDLEARRRSRPDFVSLSFETIAGFGPNGAIIHYRPESGKCAKVTADNMLLIDSGAQYRGGTTDITRTIHLSTPTQHQKECFTRVLQGHIALDSIVFPKGTGGYRLDILARAALWQVGLDYAHGTGHGVGACLNVHEGPHDIGFRPRKVEAPLELGYTVTNEPGYYEEGQFGIRIENVMVVVPKQTPFQFGGKEFYGFEHITLVPLDRKLIETAIMSVSEIAWVNAYHKECWDKVSGLLDGATKDWLRAATQPL